MGGNVTRSDPISLSLLNKYLLDARVPGKGCTSWKCISNANKKVPIKFCQHMIQNDFQGLDNLDNPEIQINLKLTTMMLSFVVDLRHEHRDLIYGSTYRSCYCCLLLAFLVHCLITKHRDNYLLLLTDVLETTGTHCIRHNLLLSSVEGWKLQNNQIPHHNAKQNIIWLVQWKENNACNTQMVLKGEISLFRGKNNRITVTLKILLH